MRIRSIKPEFWRSDDVTSLSREHRLLFIGLWSYVDDNGVGVDDFRQIAADLFALEEDQKEVRDFVREGLASLSRGFLIVRYEVDSKRYLYVTGWKKHQRVDKPNKARYPEPPPEREPPTSDDALPRETVARPSRDRRETPAPGTEEQRNRGTTDLPDADAPGAPATQASKPRGTTARNSEPDGFAAWYAVYPRREARAKAVVEYRKAMGKPGVTDQLLLAGAHRYARLVAAEGRERSKIAHPATWLHQERWTDEIPADPSAGQRRDVWTVPDDELTADDVEEILGPGRPPEPPDEFEFWDRDRRHAWNRDNYRRWQAARREQAIRSRAERLARVTRLDDHRRDTG